MKKPNVIFILIDDMGWKDLSCYGSDFYETPNIDGLASEGLRFTQAYAACPVCSPTRASLLSGKYPARVGVTDWIGAHTRGKLIDAPYTRQLPLSEYSLARAMKDGGYNTYHVGKWHLGERDYYPQNHGFDVNIAGCGIGCPIHGYFSPWNIENLENGKDGEYLTDRITDEAVKLIENTPTDEPFFMYLSHYAVHQPIQAPKEDVEYFREKAERLGLDKISPFEDGEFFPCEHKKNLRVRRRTIQSDITYAAMIYNLDKNIGRVMDTLKRRGIDNDTVVFFTSDNGGLSTSEGSPTSNAPLSEGKGWMYDGGVREPLLIRWKGHIEPAVTEQYITTPDFYPTILDIAGLDRIPSQHVDGMSFAPLLKGGQIERGAIFWHYPHYGNQGGTPGSSVRLGDYKLIEFYEDNRLELYNLREDISETTDLSAREPDITARLHKLLKDWRESVEAKLPEVNAGYEG